MFTKNTKQIFDILRNSEHLLRDTGILNTVKLKTIPIKMIVNKRPIIFYIKLYKDVSSDSLFMRDLSGMT